MLKLDNNLLDELGLGALPEAQKRAMLQHIYDTLELRVGTNLANQMTDGQLEEFEKFIDEGGDANQAQALQWLEANLPNYKQVVNDVFEALKSEIKQMAPQIMVSSATQPQVTVAPPQQGQPQMPQSTQTGSQQAVLQPVSPVGRPDPTMMYQQPCPQPAQPYAGQATQGYQFPAQQPPAGPGGVPGQPQYPDGQQAA